MLNDINFINKRIREQAEYLTELVHKVNKGIISGDRFSELFSSAEHQFNFFTQERDKLLMRTPQELMTETHKWADERFNNPSINTVALHVQLEAKELYDAIRFNFAEQDVKMEFADCFILLLQVASRYGMTFDDLLKVANEKFEINKTRKWASPDAAGIFQHID